MRKFLQIFGAISLVVFVICALLFGAFAYTLHKTAVQSKAYVDSAFPAIAAKWDQQQLIDRAAPSLFKGVDQDTEETIFYQLSLLGPMKQYEGSSMVNVYSGMKETSALYKTKARFGVGTVGFHILVVKIGGKWMIGGFHVDPST